MPKKIIYKTIKTIVSPEESARIQRISDLLHKLNSKDGYDGSETLPDGYVEDGYIEYVCDSQVNVRLTGEDMSEIEEINITFFEGELSNSTLGRILIRKGIQWYKNLSK